MMAVNELKMSDGVRWCCTTNSKKSDPVCKSQLAEQQQAKKRGAARQLLKKGGTARQFAKNKIILFAKKMFYSSICRADFRFNLLQQKVSATLSKLVRAWIIDPLSKWTEWYFLFLSTCLFMKDWELSNQREDCSIEQSGQLAMQRT